MRTIFLMLSIALALSPGCEQQPVEPRMPTESAATSAGPARSAIAWAQERLEKATGLQWQNKTFPPLGDFLAYGDSQRIYFVLPLSLDEKGRRDVAVFQATAVNAKLRILGRTEHIVVLVYVREGEAFSNVVIQALNLRPSNVTMEEIMQQHPRAYVGE